MTDQRMIEAAKVAKLGKKYDSLYRQQMTSRSGIDNNKRLAELRVQIIKAKEIMGRYPVL